MTQKTTLRDIMSTMRMQQPGAGRLYLVVLGGEMPASYALPETGAVSIGRGQHCDVCIEDPSMSRKHGLLYVGDSLRFEDLGSANGSKVRGERVASGRMVELEPGDVIEIGGTMMIVQRQSAPARARRLWAHDYFEARLENECVRADHSGVGFGLARIHLRRDVADDRVQELLGELLRPVDVVGTYGPGEYEVLLLDVDRDGAEYMMAVAKQRLTEIDPDPRAGLAWYPADGRNADALLARASAALRGEAEPDSAPPPDSIVIADPAIQNLHKVLDRVAAGTISVLLLGETGVGKEVFAERVHMRSPRRARPFLRLNCGAFTETLLESELFGYEKGAFTGAVGTKQGLLETAEGGTVFLDEVGELPPATQVKLLRVLEERTVMRVGGLQSRAIDVRFVSATNRDLEAEIAAGRFREDLFYRLNGMALVIPPLRERVSEIEPLARLFIQQGTESAGFSRAPALTQEALSMLLAYSWPGNIRELRNVMERAVLLSGGAAIEEQHLPVEKMRLAATAHAHLPAPAPAHAPAQARPADPLRLNLDEEEEQRRILAALAACAGNQTRAAEMLGIARRTLINRLDKYGIERPRKK